MPSYILALLPEVFMDVMAGPEDQRMSVYCLRLNRIGISCPCVESGRVRAGYLEL